MASTAEQKRTNGDGSVYYRKSDDRWCAALSLPSGDGPPRRVTRTAKTKRLAEVELTKLRREKAEKGDIQTTTLNVATWCRTWLEDIAAKDVRPKTLASYRSAVEQYIIPAIGAKQLKKLTTEHVRYLGKYVDEKNLSSRTNALAYQVLSLALDAAFDDRKIVENPAKRVKRPRTKKAQLVVLTPEQAKQVIKTASGWPPPIAMDRYVSRWAAAFYTGARQGELLGLEWSRVDFIKGTLDLSWQLQRVMWRHGCGDTCGFKRGNECPKRRFDAPADWEHRHITGGLYWSRPKSDSSKRIVHLVEPLYSMLELRQRQSATEPNPHGLVWTQPNGRPVDPRPDNEAWHDVLALAGVPDARLHDARHSTASLLRKAGVPLGTITRIMGHSTQAMSEEYIDYDGAQLREAMQAMSALMIEKA